MKLSSKWTVLDPRVRALGWAQAHLAEPRGQHIWNGASSQLDHPAGSHDPECSARHLVLSLMGERAEVGGTQRQRYGVLLSSSFCCFCLFRSLSASLNNNTHFSFARHPPPSLCQSKGVSGTQVWPLRSPHFRICSDPSGRAGSQSQATKRLLNASDSQAEPRDGERKVLDCFC